MKYFIIIFLFILITINHSIPEFQNDHEKDLVSRAREFVSALKNENYLKTVEHFDATMQKAAPPEKMEEVWKLVQIQAGHFLEQKGYRLEKAGNYDIIYITCEFEKTSLDIKVVFDQDKQIAGQFFVPTKPASEPKTPGYVNKNLFTETEVEVGSDEWKLPGTLTLPKTDGLVPGVVLVHGSGPNDRDETIGPNKPFLDIAWGLASKGIAVLRYDKRTKVFGKKIVSEKIPMTVKEEAIDDALLGADLLRKHHQINSEKIFILGHSLGGTLIPRIGLQEKNIAGFIIMAGLTRTLEDTMVEQYEYIFSLDGQINDEEKKQIDQVKKAAALIKKITPEDVKKNKRYLGANAAYWMDLRGYYPPEVADTLNHQMFILQGGRDYQVTKIDFDAWKKELNGKKNVQFKFYPQLNHLFMVGTGKSSPAEYQIAGNVAVYVIEDIANWIKSLSD